MFFPPTEEEIAEVRALAVDFRAKAIEAAKALDELHRYMKSKSLALSEAKHKVINKPNTSLGSTFWRIQVQRYKLIHIFKRPERVVDWAPPQTESADQVQG